MKAHMVRLQRLPVRGFIPDHIQQRQLRLCLPFYKSRRGQYVHRVRAGRAFTVNGEYSHASLTMWCGLVGSIGKGYLSAEAPENSVFCATCEGRAIGAGMDGVRKINGRFVLYQPHITTGELA